MTKTAAAAHRFLCPKCTGSGVVAGFAHVKNGVCFDCDGTGEVAVRITGGNATIKDARTVGDALLAGERVPAETAAEALAVFDDLGPGRWGGNVNYDRRNALAAYVAAAEAAPAVAPRLTSAERRAARAR